VPPPEIEPGVHRQSSQLQGVLRLRRDVPLLVAIDVHYSAEKDVSCFKALEPGASSKKVAASIESFLKQAAGCDDLS
jgi:hypothetical protein